MSEGEAPSGAAAGSDRRGRLSRTARVVGTRRYRQARRSLERIRDRAGEPVAPALARAVPVVQLEDLFEYPRRKKLTAYLLWLLAGFLGAHRFYLDREGTAVAQFLTGGGLMLWWAADVFLIPSMVRDYNRDQAGREEVGRPPRALDFLETGDRAEEGDGAAPAPGESPGTAGEAATVEGSVPGWAEDRAAGRWRLAADLAVVGFAGLCLGVVSAGTGSWRGAAAVASIVAVIGFAPELAVVHRWPGVGDLLRWAARLGLFYRYHDPGGPLARAARPVAGLFYAPFRRRARAETHLWLEVGGAFAIVFFLVDLAVLGAAALAGGGGALAELPGRWAAAAVLTLVNVYAFASPVGATLYEYVLAGRSHRRVWLLGGTALAAVAVGLAAAGAA